MRTILCILLSILCGEAFAQLPPSTPSTEHKRIQETTYINPFDLFLVLTNPAGTDPHSRQISGSNIVNAAITWANWAGGSGGGARTNSNQFGAAGAVLTLKAGVVTTNHVLIGNAFIPAGSTLVSSNSNHRRKVAIWNGNQALDSANSPDITDTELGSLDGIDITQTIQNQIDNIGGSVSHIYSGSGSPESVQIANVGAVYFCTNSCSGAAIWSKTNGYGTSTGWWQVQDTGSGAGGGATNVGPFDITQFSASGGATQIVSGVRLTNVNLRSVQASRPLWTSTNNVVTNAISIPQTYVVVEGDSLSTNFAGLPTAGNEWPSLLSQYPPWSARVFTNYSLSGRAAFDIVNGWSTAGGSRRIGVSNQFNNGILFVWAGYNDINTNGYHLGWPAVLGSLSNTWFSARQLNYEVVAFTIHQNSNNAFSTPAEANRIGLNNAIRQATAQYGYLADVDTWFTNSVANQMLASITGDGLHFNDTGTMLIASNIARLFTMSGVPTLGAKGGRGDGSYYIQPLVGDQAGVRVIDVSDTSRYTDFGNNFIYPSQDLWINPNGGLNRVFIGQARAIAFGNSSHLNVYGGGWFGQGVTNNAGSISSVDYILTSQASNSFLWLSPGGIIRTGIVGSGLTFSAATGTLTSTGSGTPGGNSTEIQFNETGGFAGTNGLRWDRTNNSLSVNMGSSLRTAVAIEVGGSDPKLRNGGTSTLSGGASTNELRNYGLNMVNDAKMSFGILGNEVWEITGSSIPPIGSLVPSTNVTMNLGSVASQVKTGFVMTVETTNLIVRGVSGYDQFASSASFHTNKLVLSIGSNTVASTQVLKVHSTSISGGINTITLTNDTDATAAGAAFFLSTNGTKSSGSVTGLNLTAGSGLTLAVADAFGLDGITNAIDWIQTASTTNVVGISNYVGSISNLAQTKQNGSSVLTNLAVSGSINQLTTTNGTVEIALSLFQIGTNLVTGTNISGRYVVALGSTGPTNLVVYPGAGVTRLEIWNTNAATVNLLVETNGSSFPGSWYSGGNSISIPTNGLSVIEVSTNRLGTNVLVIPSKDLVLVAGSGNILTTNLTANTVAVASFASPFAASLGGTGTTNIVVDFTALGITNDITFTASANFSIVATNVVAGKVVRLALTQGTAGFYTCVTNGTYNPSNLRVGTTVTGFNLSTNGGYTDVVSLYGVGTNALLAGNILGFNGP